MAHGCDRVMERLDVDGPVAVCGDVHGALHLLDALIDVLDGIPLLHVGDLVDRGADSRGVVERMIDEIGARGVRGNHDEWFTQWACGEGFDEMALYIGGEATLESYGADPRLDIDTLAAVGRQVVPSTHRAYFEALPCVLDLHVGSEKYFLVHAGLPSQPRISTDDEVEALAARHRTLLLWSKTPAHQMSRVERTVIYGHVPDVEPHDFGAFIALDTGAGRWRDRGRLTAVILPERRFVTVQ